MIPRLLLFFVVSLFSFFCAAKTAASSRPTPPSDESSPSLQVYLPGLQVRYEDGPDQEKNFCNYDHYAISGMFENFLVGLEYDTKKESSGNSSLALNTESKEIDLLFGYSFVRYNFGRLPSDLSIELLGFGVAGQLQTDVKTTLLGQPTDNSASEATLGAGLMGLVRYGYFIFAIDSRLMRSQAYSPNSVSVSTAQLGANIRF